MKSLKDHILNALKLFLAGLKSNVINNFVSTSTTLPLSANCGKTLNDKISSLSTKSSENNILWQGSVVGVQQGTEDATPIKLSENITDQKNGIVLVFSTHTSVDRFSSFYIPKNFIIKNPNEDEDLHYGYGVHCLMLDANYIFASKYVYIDNSELGLYSFAYRPDGKLDNLNNSYALKYVIGV